jgi:hypothetical protein
MELHIGDQVQMYLEDGGTFVGHVTGFSPDYPDNNVAVITPDREPVRDVFPKGYNLGRAHWSGNNIKILARATEAVEG